MGITSDLSSLKAKVSSKLKGTKDKRKAKKESEKPTSSTASNSDVEIKQREEKELIRREAFALGATEKDLELIKGLSGDEDNEEASEQEFGDGKDGVDNKFEEDLQNLLKNIGLDKQTAKDFPQDDEEVSEEETVEAIEEEDVSQEDVDEDLPPNSDSNSESEEVPVEEERDQTKESKVYKDSGPISQNNMVDSEKLIIPFDTVWYDVPLDSYVVQNLQEKRIELSADQIAKLYERGKQTLQDDNQTYYDEFTKESSQKKFMSQMLSGGTLNDKISALTLLIQESPIHNLKSFETLVSFCNKKSRNSILQSLNALKDLFLNGLLPDRKLRFFKNQPGLSMMLNKKTLAVFYFEDFLKKTFFQLLEVFEKLSHDPIIHVRLQCLNHIFDLLSSKPEQELNLLRLGVNKLGDIDSKVSSKSSYLLLKLEQAHPNMKGVIIDAIVDVALRPNADYHSTYYSVITLNQTILKRSEDSVANKLIKTYFTLFEKHLIVTDSQQGEEDNAATKSSAKSYESKRKKNFKKGKKGGMSVKNEKTDADLVSEKNSKLFSALLTGVNRAFPFAQVPASVYEAHLETLFRITHSSNFNTSVQALVLINQVIVKAKLNNDRYYRTLYESLLDPRLVISSKQGIYLNLLYKSLKQDVEHVERVEAFVKRILQVCSHWLNVGTIAGFFYLLLQLVKEVPQIKNLLINTPVDDEYQSDNEASEAANNTKRGEYDSRKRDPKFANADHSSLWEITQFTNHFHPTVQMYVQAFIEGKNDEVTKPDLGLYTLAHFLDRFVYRNAKQKPIMRGTSIMQPLFGGSQINHSVLVRSSDYAVNQTPVNTENWLHKRIEDIKPDEKFFYQYFSTKQSAMKTKKKQDDNSDGELDEDEVWNALVQSRPDVEDDSDEGDVGFSDEDFDSLSDIEDVGSDQDEDDEEEEEKDELDEDDDDSKSEEDIFYSFIDDETKEEEADEAEAAEAAEEEEDEEEYVEEQTASKKRANNDGKETGNKHKKSRRNKIKNLPLYASVDDYAKYLNSDDEADNA